MADDAELDKAQKLIDKLKGEIKDLKADKEPQAEKDQRTIAALRREIDELKPLADKAKKADEDGKSSDTKFEERLQAAEKRAQEAESRALRLEIVTAKGLSTAQAKYLSGATKEELEASADQILDDFPTSTEAGDGDGKSKGAGGASTTTTRPKENLQGGTDSTEEPEETDPRKLASSIPRS